MLGLREQGALNAYKAAADIAPGVPANYANCAAAALMLRQYKEAADFAGHAAALDPTFVRAHMRAGKACLLMGRFDQVRTGACDECGALIRAKVMYNSADQCYKDGFPG